MTTHDGEIQAADPVLRRRTLVLLAIGVVLAAVGVRWLDAHLRGLLVLARNSPHEAAEDALAASRVALAALVLGVSALAAYLGRLSWRTLRGGRYPPAGVAVINDTRILRDAEARRYGRWGLCLAALLWLAGLGVTWALHHKLSELLDTTLKPTLVSPAELAPR